MAQGRDTEPPMWSKLGNRWDFQHWSEPPLVSVSTLALTPEQLTDLHDWRLKGALLEVINQWLKMGLSSSVRPINSGLSSCIGGKLLELMIRLQETSWFGRLRKKLWGPCISPAEKERSGRKVSRKIPIFAQCPIKLHSFLLGRNLWKTLLL